MTSGKTIIAVYGASGCGRGVMPVLREMIESQDSSSETELIFVDDGVSESVVNGYRVLAYSDFLALDTEVKQVSVAIADSGIRQCIAEQCEKDGLQLITVSASNVVKMDKIELGDGAILCPFVTLTSNIKIGKAFHANLYSYVEHDCVIGDYVTFAPAVKCNGNVVIEDHAYIGAAAVLRQGSPEKPLVIGAGAVVGMGAVVTKDVAANTTVVGNPARVLEGAV
jgi:sugar O-acyltransferase (sialic acid O-acetyltransferase NeuD family)